MGPQYEGVSWADMNYRNVELCQKKLKDGYWWRNVAFKPPPSGKLHNDDRILGCIGRQIIDDEIVGSGGSAPADRVLAPRPKKRPKLPAKNPPQPPTPKQIQVMTMGACVAKDTVIRSKTAGQLQYMANQKGRGGGLGPALDHSMFHTLMQEVSMGFESLVVLDARMFQDPDKRRGQDRAHIGLHAEKQLEVTRHKELPAWMRRARQAISSRIASIAPGSKLGVLVYCRKGAHRSVAAGALLHHCLFMRSKDLNILPVWHWSKRHLWRNSYCGECKECVDSQSWCHMSGAELPSTFPLTHYFPPTNHFPTKPIHLPANPPSLPPIHFPPTHHFPTTSAGQPFDERCGCTTTDRPPLRRLIGRLVILRRLAKKRALRIYDGADTS